MAEKSDRSKRILGNALAVRRKLCFNTDGLGDGCTNNTMQNHTFENLPLSNHNVLSQRLNLTSKKQNIGQLQNLTESDKDYRQPNRLLEPSTSRAYFPSCAENTQPKVLILSDTTISGPSGVSISFSGKGMAKPETYVSQVLQSTSFLDVPTTIPESSDFMIYEEINDLNSKGLESGKLLCLDEYTKPLSPVINIRNDSIMLPDGNNSDKIVEPLPVDEIPEHHLDTKKMASEVSKNNKSKRKRHESSYIDFMSNDGDFEWSSSSWEVENQSSSGDEEEQNTRKKQNKVIRDGKIGDLGSKKKKKLNKRKERSLNRIRGLSYLKKDGAVVAQKTMKENPCKSDKKCPHYCHEISDERRQQIFAYYYSLSSERKRDWLVANSQTIQVKRSGKQESLSRRQNTFLYYINEGEGRRQVCQRFILYTLDLSQRFVHYTLSNAESNLSKTDMRGKHVPANKTSNSVKQGVVDYIKKLPVVPSHYCRKDSSRLYLPQEFKNLTHLYQLYKSDFINKGKDYVGEKVFKNIFTSEFNITFHIPKKDKCKKCVSFTNDPSMSEEAKAMHLKEAEDSKSRFKFHQNITKRDSATLCVSFDLQKVLNTPYGESMLFYYSRKYAIYNLTFFESSTREGYCYSWGENDGKRGGNEIATILNKYIKMVDERGTIKNLLLYSDSCSGQNKNIIVFAAVHTTLQACQYVESIQMNFLLPGHTSMPVDSMHAIIENSIKNTVIHAPSQWSTVFSLARKNPKPYNVEVFKYTDFVAWDSISDKYFKNNLAGKISQLRVITFKKSDLTHVFIKNSMGNEAKSEKVFVLGKHRIPSQCLYKKTLPISDAKYNDLANHCKNSSIPHQFHDEYLKMHHGNIKDTLPESDVEDSD